MSINRNVIVPIPDDANHPKKGKRVFITLEKIYDPDRKYNCDRRKTIGEACSQTEMYPNDAYKIIYPDIYNQHAPHEQKLPVPSKIIGVYAAFLAIGLRSGLYETLITSFGPLNANMIMDYSIYSILMNSNVSKDFADTMEHHLLFSEKAYSDTWISEFFKNRMTDDQGLLFRENWAGKCRDDGIESVWICIDGSNGDCDSSRMPLAEYGHDKSGNGGPVVSYMWAVSSKDGRPITYCVYRGARVDAKAIQEITAYLESYKIKVAGIILDRGFWSTDDVRLLKEKGYDFVIMMKDGRGIENMKEKYGHELRAGNVKYMIQKTGMYGVTDHVQVFRGSEEQLCVTLFYDNAKGARKTNKLTDVVKKTKAAAEDAIRQNREYHIPSEMKPFVKIRKYKGRKKNEVYIDTEELQLACDSKGFSALASSIELTPDQADSIYQLRQFSEKQYAAFKSQLGFDVLRVYAKESWLSKFAVGFAAGILRNEFENYCKGAGLDTNQTIKELMYVMMSRMPDNRYIYIRMMSSKAKTLLKAVGLIESDMSLIAEEENNRINGPYHHPIHSLPIRNGVKKGPGRPKGSKDKKGKKEKVSSGRGPGRPKGSKNKKTLEREASELKNGKRRPGRPKGSKNRTTIEKGNRKLT